MRFCCEHTCILYTHVVGKDKVVGAAFTYAVSMTQWTADRGLGETGASWSMGQVGSSDYSLLRKVMTTLYASMESLIYNDKLTEEHTMTIGYRI